VRKGIRTPDQRLRVFVSSTLGELAEERLAVRRAVESLHLSPVMFELGARPHPPRELYRAYLEQSDVFIGIYWERYGWVAPGESISGLEDEYRLAGGLPQLLYIKDPAPGREPALAALLRRVQDEDRASYRRFSSPETLEELVSQDLALLLSERFDQGRAPEAPTRPAAAPLPAPLTRTIGRAKEVGELVALVDAGTRLVTVTGPGGVGKTRLALEVGRALADRPGSVVHFVPLAPVSEPALVLAGVADRLGARGDTARRPFDALVEHLGDRPAVLLLDNLEQVVDVGPELVRLLEQAPGLQILATSRQALRVVGEHEFPAGPLAVPGEAATPEEIRRTSSVELLVERARARGVSMDLTPDDAAAVAELCRRLAGLPLAIELAVPRLRLLSPRQVLGRLTSTLDLPSAGTDLPSRQRSLRAALTWSHELLDEQERSLFAQLSVFSGGATLEAVEQVCATGEEYVDTALAGLLDKSLLSVGDSTPGREPRIQMLEPVRDFAREQLDLRGATDEARQRHLDYFCALGREAQPFLCGPRQREWAARFDGERANVRTAVATGLELHAFAPVLRLIWDTLVYYYVRDAVDEPRQWLRKLAGAAGHLGTTQQALLDVGLLIVGEGPPDQRSDDLLDDATNVFDRSGLALEAAVSRQYVGLHHWHSDRRAESIEVLGEASRRFAALDHDWGVATVEMTLGAIHASGGRWDAARAHYAESLVHSRLIENRHQMAQALQGLALVDALDGRTHSAVDALREAVELILSDRSVTGATYCLEALAALALAGDDAEEAVRLVGTARGTRRRRMIPDWTAADAAEPVLAAARRELSPGSFAELWDAAAEQNADVLELLGESFPALSERWAPVAR